MYNEEIHLLRCKAYEPIRRVLAIILSAIIALFFLLGLWAIIVGKRSMEEKIFVLFGIIFALRLYILIVKTATSCKISLIGTKLTITGWKEKFIPYSMKYGAFLGYLMFPKTITNEIDLKEVRIVVLGFLKPLKDYAHEIGDDAFLNSVKQFKKQAEGLTGITKIMTANTKFIYILDNKGTSYLVDTAYFLKKSTEGFLSILEKKGIEVKML